MVSGKIFAEYSSLAGEDQASDSNTTFARWPAASWIMPICRRKQEENPPALETAPRELQ